MRKNMIYEHFVFIAFWPPPTARPEIDIGHYTLVNMRCNDLSVGVVVVSQEWPLFGNKMIPQAVMEPMSASTCTVPGIIIGPDYDVLLLRPRTAA
jgi:hypothetical protein